MNLEIINKGQRGVASRYFRGLYVIQFVNTAGLSTVSYDFDYEKESEMRIGDHKTYRMTTKGPNGKKSTLVVDYTIVGREVVTLEGCPPRHLRD